MSIGNLNFTLWLHCVNCAHPPEILGAMLFLMMCSQVVTLYTAGPRRAHYEVSFHAGEMID